MIAASRVDVVQALFDERYSCRGFRSEQVPREAIERILTTAQRTPSWCNAQPWQVVIVSGAALNALRPALVQHVQTEKPTPDFEWPGAYRGVYDARRRECGLQLYKAVGVERGDKAAADRQRLENFKFFGAPHVALITTDAALGIYGAVDCGAYVNSFTLAARACGVAAIAQAALAAYPAFWRSHLHLGEDRRIVCGISFGFEDPAHPANGFRTTRATIDAAVTWVGHP